MRPPGPGSAPEWGAPDPGPLPGCWSRTPKQGDARPWGLRRLAAIAGENRDHIRSDRAPTGPRVSEMPRLLAEHPPIRARAAWDLCPEGAQHISPGQRL